jgi:FADH2 O2-dependent halogenase
LRRGIVTTLESDVAVVGSGFAGSLLAMILRRQGRSVVLLEKGRHPRFAIGESSTPLANLLLEEIAARWGLPRLAPLSKWGTWRAAYPEVGVGLKRGFTFLRHARGEPFAGNPSHDDQLMVAASPRDEVADTHWYRPDFDAFLLEEAKSLGADSLDETRLTSAQRGGGAGGAWRLNGIRHGRNVAVSARFLVDATGPHGFLHRLLGLGEGTFADLPATEALYTHFQGVSRLDEMESTRGAFLGAPYPADDAALHHVFDGGWVWVLRFANGIVSAGVSARRDLARELRFEDGAPAWDRFLALFPTIREQFERARAVVPFFHLSPIPFRSLRAAGEGFALLPYAAGFVDPLLSTGFPLTLLGIARLAEATEAGWGSPDLGGRLGEYERKTLGERDMAALLVAALYRNLADFDLFRRLSLLYFAAASWSETARRVGRPDKAGSFLLSEDPAFGPALRECCRRALGQGEGQGQGQGPGPLQGPERAELLRRIDAAVGPFDVSGLSTPGRSGWYPCDFEDVLRAAPRLDVSPPEIRRRLARFL